MLVGVERGPCLELTTLPPTVSRMSRQCGILNISQPYRPPRPVTGIALLYFAYSKYFGQKRLAGMSKWSPTQGHTFGQASFMKRVCLSFGHFPCELVLVFV
jgi:hypothetical protein